MKNEQLRILAIYLSSRGFGYAVMEGDNRLVAYGNKVINKYKNTRVVAQVKKVIKRYEPSFLVLQDVNAKGTHRGPRIKALNRKIIKVMKKRKLEVVKLSGTQLRMALLGNLRGSKEEIAETLATMFPDELASRLPPKRKLGDSKDVRMDIFDSVALTVAFRETQKTEKISHQMPRHI